MNIKHGDNIQEARWAEPIEVNLAREIGALI